MLTTMVGLFDRSVDSVLYCPGGEHVPGAGLRRITEWDRPCRHVVVIGGDWVRVTATTAGTGSDPPVRLLKRVLPQTDTSKGASDPATCTRTTPLTGDHTGPRAPRRLPDSRRTP